MGDVLLVEVFAVVERLEPELAEGFALAVRADDAVEADEAGEAHAVEAFLVEDGGGVLHALGHVGRKIEGADCGFGGETKDALSDTLYESGCAFLLGALQRFVHAYVV